MIYSASVFLLENIDITMSKAAFVTITRLFWYAFENTRGAPPQGIQIAILSENFLHLINRLSNMLLFCEQWSMVLQQVIVGNLVRNCRKFCLGYQTLGL